ncbi:hypothetical protein AB0I84_40880 [Streptomyces spectabilis]|uniref:hypothetical protein n=1 Tax=Streptomyces spectabilis TaxID=68270 RepID=UPI0033CDEE53
MRKLRLPARRPRLAALLAAGLAAAALGLAATLSGTESTGADRPARSTEIVAAYNDGWIDGQADLRGDDNRDGRIDEDESGWHCRTMGNRVCGTRIVPDECKGAGDAAELCVTVARRPAYGWTNPDGSRVDNPDGRTQVRDLDEKPGTPEFTAALRALDAEWRAHH